MAFDRGTVARGPVVNRSVEHARRKLPINQYLYLLHVAATTGYMPTLDRDSGEPLPIPEGTSVLSPMQRLPFIEKLLDKSMPDAKYDHEPDAIDAEAVKPEEIFHLRSEQLQYLLEDANAVVHAVPPA